MFGYATLRVAKTALRFPGHLRQTWGRGDRQFAENFREVSFVHWLGLQTLTLIKNIKKFISLNARLI